MECFEPVSSKTVCIFNLFYACNLTLLIQLRKTSKCSVWVEVHQWDITVKHIKSSMYHHDEEN